MIIRVVEETLTDGSKVTNIILDGKIMLPCVTWDDAYDLAHKLQYSIEQHTNEYAKVKYDHG